GLHRAAVAGVDGGDPAVECRDCSSLHVRYQQAAGDGRVGTDQRRRWASVITAYQKRDRPVRRLAIVELALRRMLMDDLTAKISSLVDSRVVESAVPLLAQQFNVDDPLEASNFVAAAVGDDKVDATALDAAARRAVKEDSGTIIELMRLMLI